MLSGLWPGYWSYSCEKWFQACHWVIMEHKGDLKTVGECKNAMKLYKQVAKLCDTNAVLTSAYFDTQEATM